jgi:phosphate-selective porin OprO/OprP
MFKKYNIGLAIALTATTISAAEPVDQNVKVTLTPAPKFESADGKYSFTIGGYAQYDVATFDNDKINNDANDAMRNARISIGGTIDQDWGFKIENNFANNTSRLNSAFVEYYGLDPISLTVGHFSHDFGLENSMSSRNITFLEPAAISAFGPAPNDGVAISTNGDNWYGIIAASGASTPNGQQRAVTLRSSFAPINTEIQTVHFGFSGSYMAPKPSVSVLSYSVKPEVAIALPALNTGTISNFTSTKTGALEFAAVNGPASIQAEYMVQNISRKNLPNNKFKGYYVQAAYTLTGEFRPYNATSGTFSGINPVNPFNLKTGGMGAWEVAVRYSNIDLNGRTIKAGKMEDYGLGLNWYLNKNVRTSLGLNTIRTDQYAATPKNNPRILMLRAQFAL